MTRYYTIVSTVTSNAVKLMKYPFVSTLLFGPAELFAQTTEYLIHQKDLPKALIGWFLIIVLLILLVAGVWMYVKLQKQKGGKSYPNLLRKKGDIYLFIESKELSREILEWMKEEISEKNQNGNAAAINVIVPEAAPNVTTETPSSPLSEVEEKLLKKIGHIVEAEMSNPDFSITDLCKTLGMSHSQLHRKLKTITGLSPSQMIKSLKIEKAKDLLKNPALTITAIAYDSGFTDPAYFHRVFKQEVGLTPKQYRELK